MKKARAGLITFSILLFICAHIRIGYNVRVGGWTSEGVYSPRTVSRCIYTAQGLAEEMSSASPNVEDLVELSLGISGTGYCRKEKELCSNVFTELPGVNRFCAIKVDGELVGWLENESELGELIQVMISEISSPYTVSVNIMEDISAAYSYAPDSTETDPMIVSRNIRERISVEVVNMEPTENEDIIHTATMHKGLLYES